MKIKGAVIAAIVLGTLVACQPEEQTQDDCQWELETVAMVTGTSPRPPAPRPAPAPRPPAARVPGAKPPVKMPTVKPPKPRSTPPVGKVWDYDCD